MTEQAPVTQADRKAMVDYENARPVPLNAEFAKDILAGIYDNDTRVRAFASLRLASQRQGADWQTMESAPKDGSYVDLWCAPLDESGTALTPCRIPNCYWVEDYSAWYAVSLRGEPIRVWHRVTHWRPEDGPPAALSTPTSTTEARDEAGEG